MTYNGDPTAMPFGSTGDETGPTPLEGYSGHAPSLQPPNEELKIYELHQLESPVGPRSGCNTWSFEAFHMGHHCIWTRPLDVKVLALSLTAL